MSAGSPGSSQGMRKQQSGGKCVFCELQLGETTHGDPPYTAKAKLSLILSGWATCHPLTHVAQSCRNLSLSPLCPLWGRSFLPPSTLTGHTGHPLLRSRPPLLLWCSWVSPQSPHHISPLLHQAPGWLVPGEMKLFLAQGHISQACQWSLWPLTVSTLSLEILRLNLC